MANQIQLRQDTAANWTFVNPTMAAGEVGFESDTLRFKLGDGTTAWASLAYTLNYVLNGTSVPSSGIGVNGDFYINTTTSTMYGPKATGSWPTGVSLVGPTGPQGVQGTQGIQGIQGTAGATGPAGADGTGMTPQAVGFTVAGGTTSKTLTITGDTTLAGTPAGGDAANNLGYHGVPQNSQSAAYTTVLSDAGKHLLHPAADTTARTFTIAANASVAYPVQTVISFVNQNAGGVITIAIATDTMRLAGAGTTGNRTLAANGIATALKITSTEWIISGTGLT